MEWDRYWRGGCTIDWLTVTGAYSAEINYEVHLLWWEWLMGVGGVGRCSGGDWQEVVDGWRWWLHCVTIRWRQLSGLRRIGSCKFINGYLELLKKYVYMVTVLLMSGNCIFKTVQWFWFVGGKQEDKEVHDLWKPLFMICIMDSIREMHFSCPMGFQEW